MKDLTRLSSDEILALLTEYVKQLQSLRAWGWIPVLLDGGNTAHLTDYLLEQLRAALPNATQENLSSYYAILSSSEKLSHVRTEELARLELAGWLLNQPSAKQIISFIYTNRIDDLRAFYPSIHTRLHTHLQTYGWLTYGYTGPAMDIGFLFETLTNDLQQAAPFSVAKEIRQQHQRLPRDKQRLLEQFSIPAALQRLFMASSTLMHLKDFRKGVYQRSYLLLDDLLQELSYRAGLSLRELKYTTHHEMEQLLCHPDSSLWKQKIQRRINHCCLVTTKGTSMLIEGDACVSIIQQLDATPRNDLPDPSTKKILRGMTAYPGNVTGVIQIVKTRKDALKVNNGDILVSPSTNPDLILAMKRSAAIITDMGGITSHAAIVARELRKPCVVGTKHATRKLKDGDTVIVDAHTGTITIL